MTSAPSLPERSAAVAAWRDLAFALLVGLGAYALSCALVWPLDTLPIFSANWQKMSVDPFALLGDFPHRLLTPLLAWLCGCRGEPGFLWFVRGVTVLMLATACLFARRRGATPLDAVLVAVAVAVISPVQIYKLHWVGYVDATTYTLLLWMLLVAHRPGVFWSLFFAALLNHELAAFLLPWAWFVRRQHDDRRRIDVLGAAAALGLYTAFYFYVRAAAPSQLYNIDFFTRYPLFPGGTFATLVVALVHWVVAFGPVLAVLGWFHHAPATRGERGHLWWCLLGILVIFCIAWDWARHTNLLVVPLVVASTRFLVAGHRWLFVALVVSGVGLMLRWSPWPTVSWPTSEFASVPLLVGTGVVVGNETVGIGFGPLSAATTRWLPAVWPALWPILLIAAAIWTTGFFIARVRKTPSSSGS